MAPAWAASQSDLAARWDSGRDERAADRRLRLLSYNIQTGISCDAYHQYVTRSWRYVLPHRRRQENLDRVAQVVSPFDIVGLQEVDAGSLRTGFVNQVEYLALKAGFPFWHHHVHRNLGSLAQHSNGLLSRYRPTSVEEHKLPGLLPGRGVILVKFGDTQAPLVIAIMHLALGRRGRQRQLEYVSDLVNDHRHVVLMGDMNCQFLQDDLELLQARTCLREPVRGLPTFPSWQPNRHLDHILVSPTLEVAHAHVVRSAVSDHLPIAMEVVLPPEVRLSSI